MDDLVNVLRSKYPEPKISGCGQCGRNYCVGGALYLHRGYTDGFPPPNQLADALLEENPALSEYSALTLAVKITTANDAGDFNVAWRWMEHALTIHAAEVEER